MEPSDKDGIVDPAARERLKERLAGLPPDEVRRLLTSPEPGELSEEELALVTGGKKKNEDSLSELYYGDRECPICHQMIPASQFDLHMQAETYK